MVYYANSKWYVYGIVSFDIPQTSDDCNYQSPSYYTQVPAYLSWIENKLHYHQLSSFAYKKSIYYTDYNLLIIVAFLNNI